MLRAVKADLQGAKRKWTKMGLKVVGDESFGRILNVAVHPVSLRLSVIDDYPDFG